MADVETVVLDIIAQKAGVERDGLHRATEISSLGLESLDIVEIIFDIEEKLDISLLYNANEASSTDGGSFKTVGEVVDFVIKHVGQRDERKTV
jgi:acyl carrier protein